MFQGSLETWSGKDYWPNEKERERKKGEGRRERGRTSQTNQAEMPSFPPLIPVWPHQNVSILGSVLGYVPLTQFTRRSRQQKTEGSCAGKAFEEEVRKGRDRVTLGQIFWGHSSGNPELFCPYLANLFRTHKYFPHPPFSGQHKCSLAFVWCGQGEGHPSTHICRVCLQHFKRLS